jgi:hypothetical protein
MQRSAKHKVECHEYANCVACRYDECRYVECRGAQNHFYKIKKKLT